MKPYLHHAGNLVHFQWNLDCSVGKGGANSLPADVFYLQWYYSLAAQHPLTPEDRKSIYRQVRINGICRGSDDDPLVAAIFAHQRALNHPQVDGKVSVAQGTGKIGVSAYFILRLGARLANMYPSQWPRLDLIPSCPALVAQAVHAAIPSV
ncbi:MAG TPA: hypothetical protein VMT22_07455 [Terriglobales bacterium]|nr:hypothetical protein [Terriglobales bacterium]